MINLRNKRIMVTFLMHLGDLILITPFLQVLRRYAYGSEITLAVDKKVADAVRYNPNIDRLIEIDKKGPTIPSVLFGASAEACIKKAVMSSSISILMNGRPFWQPSSVPANLWV